MTDTILPDGTKMSVIIANLNVFTSNPSTSAGEGEIIYNSTDNKVYVNTGTTTTPTWTEIGTGSGGVTDHNLLNNLTWSAAGHTINADVDFDNNKLQLGSSTYIQDVIAEVRYISDDYHKFYIGSTELLSIDSEWVEVLGGLDVYGGIIFDGSASYKLDVNTVTGTLKYEASSIHEFEIGVGNTIMKLDTDGIDLNGKALELDSGTVINDNTGDMELHVGTGKCVKIVVG